MDQLNFEEVDKSLLRFDPVYSLEKSETMTVKMKVFST